MAEYDVRKVSAEIETIHDRYLVIEAKSKTRREQIGKVDVTPSVLLHNVFSALRPLASYVAADGDVTKEELASKEQSAQVAVLIAPIMTALDEGAKTHEDLSAKCGLALEQAKEDRSELDIAASGLNRQEAALKAAKDQQEKRKQTAQSQKVEFEARKSRLEIEEKALEARRLEDESVVHPQYEPGLWGKLKEIGWDLARDDQVDAYGNRTMSEGGMLESSCREDLRAVADLMEANEKQLQSCDVVIEQCIGNISLADKAQKSVEWLARRVQSNMARIKVIIEEDDRDIKRLGDVRERMGKIFSQMSDVNSEMKAGLKVAFRRSLAKTILAVVMEAPLDDGIRVQARIIVDSLAGMATDSRVYSDIDPTIREAKRILEAV